MKTRDVTFLAIGIALFITLSMCLQVPVFDNYYLCLGYIVMMVYVWCFKWYEGAIIGFFGVILYCIIGGLGFNGMPGWSVGNIVIGLITGFAVRYIKKIRNKIFQIILMAIVAVIAAFIGIELVKSFIDSFIVSQPFLVRFVKNMTSFVADAFVIVISLPICAIVEKYAKNMRYSKQE